MIRKFADMLTYGLMGFEPQSHLGNAVDFFIYDTVKITVLLFAVSVVMGIINAYFPTDRVRRYLSKSKLYGAEYLIAALLGAVTPFCSCSSIPLFIGFVKGGIPLGVTFAFLITSPLVNEIAIAMFAGTFGWKITVIYAACGILAGIAGGCILGRMNLRDKLTPWVRQLQTRADSEAGDWHIHDIPFLKRLPSVVRESFGIVRSVFVYIIMGIGVGAAIHGFVPDDFFSRWMGSGAWYAVPLSVILAVPMYANAAGVIPVVQVLVSKGVSVGTALAFMMAVTGLSLPEATMLKKVMTWKLIGIFFGVTTVEIIVLGYLFNLML